MILCFNLNPAMDKTLEIPGFHVGGHLKARTLAFIPAGKGLNVARGLAAMGAKSLAVGFVGEAELPWFSDELRRCGAESRFVAARGRTRTNTTIIDPDNATTTHLREEGFQVSEENCAELFRVVEEAFDAHSHPCEESRRDACATLDGNGRRDACATLAVISGSLPPGFPEERLAELIGLCRRRGAEVFVDASGNALRTAVQAGVQLVKPNEEELAELAGRALTSQEVVPAARELLRRVDTALVSLGERGGIAVTRSGAWGARVPLPRSEIVNTVGCGDAFLCGWIAAVTEGRPPQEAIAYAVAAGTACVRLPTAGGYDRAMVMEMLARCERFDPGVNSAA